MPTPNASKSLILENKADGLASRGKDKKAFAIYQEALELNPDRLELYDKIIAVHSKYQDNWTDEDFSYNLFLTMKKQETADPAFKRIHARLESGYKEVQQLIKNMLAATAPASETECVEKIVAKGVIAIYPLIDYVLGFKLLGKKNLQERLKEKLQEKNAIK